MFKRFWTIFSLGAPDILWTGFFSQQSSKLSEKLNLSANKKEIDKKEED